MKPIPYSRQDIDEQDIAAVVEVLRSDFLTQGPRTKAFEKALADFAQAKHAIVCANATAALHCAMIALDVGPGDRVWTSPISFVASANCALYAGAKVDFVDVDPATGNMDVDLLEEKLHVSAARNELPKVIIPVHFSGRICDMSRIAKLARQHNVKVVEDAAHAFGSTDSEGFPAGACRFSDITVYSFHPVKTITTGEGGALTANDSALAERLSLLVTHGITRDRSKLQDQSRPEYYYEQQILGYNFRLNEIEAALGISQMSRVKEFVAKRNFWAKAYESALANSEFDLPPPDENSAWHLYVAGCENRESRFARLREAGILVNVHYLPIHLQPYYRTLGFKKGDFPQAEKFSERALSLPIFTQLTNEEHDYVIKTLLRS